MIAPVVDPVPSRAAPRRSKKRASGAAPPDSLRSNSDSGAGANIIDTVHREDMIRQAAYFRAEQRGFTPGHELQDWLVAEQQIDQWLNGAAISDGHEG
jgi:hypothetical protein